MDAADKTYKAALKACEAPKELKKADRDYAVKYETNEEKLRAEPEDPDLLKERDKLRETYEERGPEWDILGDECTLRVAYAWYLRRRNYREDARVQIDEAIKRAPYHNTLPLQTLARFLRDDRRPEEALEMLERARRKDPTDYRIYGELAVVHRMLRNVPAAMTALRAGAAKLEELITEAGTSPKAKREKAVRRAARAQLNYELVRMILTSITPETEKTKRQEMLAEARACAKVIRETRGQEAISISLDGQIAFYEGKYDEALKLLEKAQEAFGERLEPVTALLLMQLYQRPQVGAVGKAEAILDRFLANPQQRHNALIRLEKARMLMWYRNWTAAERYVHEALRIDPENQVAKRLLAVIALQTGRANSLPADMKSSPRVIKGVLVRVRSLWADERRQQAIELIEDLHKRAPDDMQVTQQLINMYQLGKEEEKLKALLEKLKTDKPELVEQIQYQQDLLAEKDPAKKLAMQIKWAEKIEDALQRELAMADLYRSAKQMDKYIEHLNKAAEIKSDAPGVILRKIRYAVLTKNWELAEKAIAEAAKANTDGANGKLLAARLALDRGKEDVAIRTYTEILAENSNSKQARILRGQLYMRQGKLAEAAEDFLEVAESDPGNAAAAISMMLVTERQGKANEFDEWLDRAYRLAPQNSQVVRRFTNRQERRTASPEEIIAKREKQLIRDPKDLNNCLRLGFLYERTGKPTKAENMFVNVWKFAADKILGTQHLASFYTRTNRLGQADKLIQDLLKTTDDKVSVYVMYGEFLAPYKPDQARRAFGSAIQADPENPTGHYALARFHAKQTKWAEAIQAMSQCVELRKDAPGLEKQLIGYQINGGRFGDAESRLNRILTVSPTDAAALRLKAQLVLRRDNDVTAAEDLLSTAIRENANDVGSLLDRAQLYVAVRKLDKARIDYEKARQIVDSISTVLKLAGVYAGMKQYRHAELALMDVLKRAPKMSEAIERLASVYVVQEKWRDFDRLMDNACKAQPEDPKYWILKAEGYTRREKRDKALAALAEAAKIAPENPAIVMVYLNGLLGAEQYAKVIDVSKPYLDKKGFTPMVPALYARALAKSGKVPEAEAIFQDLVKKATIRSLKFLAGQVAESFGLPGAIARLPRWRANPDEWQLYQVVAGLHHEANQMSKAIESLVKARDLAPRDSDAQASVNMILGMAYYRTGRLRDAEKAYRAVLTRRPNDVNVLNNLAFLYVDDLAQPDKALPYAAKAYRQAPRDSNVMDTYAWVLAKLDRYKEAEKLLTALVRRENVIPASRLHLGWVYEQQNRLTEAKQQYDLGREMTADRERDKKLYDKFVESIGRVQGKKLNR